MRMQATAGNLTINCYLQLMSAGAQHPSSLSLVTAYGANVADTGGVSVDPGASISTKGAYSEIVSSTTFPISALVIGIGNQNNLARAVAQWYIDIAVGAGGSEMIIIPDIMIRCVGSGYKIWPQFSPTYPISILVGSRIAVRAECTMNDATDRIFDVVLYGIS